MEAIHSDSVSTQTSAQDSVENLIQQARAGKDWAFGALYERFRPRVAKFLYNASGDYHLADELSNDTFLRVHRALPGLEQSQESSFLSFLFRTAANLLCDHRRRKNLPTTSVGDDRWDGFTAAGDSCTQPTEYLENQERDKMLRQGMDELPAEQAALISLSHFEQLSAKEIARILNKPSAQAVRASLHRAMQNLHKILLQQGYFVESLV